MPDTPTIRDRDDTTLSAGRAGLDPARGPRGPRARGSAAPERPALYDDRRQALAHERRAPADQTPRGLEPPRLSRSGPAQGPP